MPLYGKSLCSLNVTALEVTTQCNIEMCILLLLLFFLNPRKNEGGKKLRKVERGLKWKTSPGGPQRENRRAAIRR